MQGRAFIELLCAMMGVAASAMAGITPVDQAREVFALASFVTSEEEESDSDADSAFDFGPFDAAVDASITLFDPNSGPTIDAGASQNSAIEPQSLFGTGGASAANEDGTFNAEGESASTFAVDFTIDVPGTYLLSGSLQAGDSMVGFGQAQIDLTGPGGTIYSLTAEDAVLPIASGGAVLPGAYTLTVTALAMTNASLETADAAFDFSFTFVPEPAAGGALLLLAMFGRRMAAGRIRS